MPKRVALSAVLVLLVAVAAGGAWWWLSGPRTDLERAVALAPADSQRVTWTHWAAVRTELDADLSAESSSEELTRFLDRGFEADLTSASALLQSAGTLHREYGFSPATVEWELLSQSEQGAVVILQLPDDADMDAIADRLADLGYERPDQEDGVWRGGAQLLPRIAPELTPELQYVALDADERRVLTSDTADFLASTVEGLGEDDGPEQLAGVVEASGEPLSAVVYDGAHACQALAMSTADEGDQAQAEELVAAAGEVNPMRAFAMAALPDGDVRVVMDFESEEQARANADARAALADGPAPGQGGDFADRFGLGPVTADGTAVTMTLRPVSGGYVMSDLSSGPVLFATC
jgi:hypothetical protein